MITIGALPLIPQNLSGVITTVPRIANGHGWGTYPGTTDRAGRVPRHPGSTSLGADSTTPVIPQRPRGGGTSDLCLHQTRLPLSGEGRRNRSTAKRSPTGGERRGSVVGRRSPSVGDSSVGDSGGGAEQAGASRRGRFLQFDGALRRANRRANAMRSITAYQPCPHTRVLEDCHHGTGPSPRRQNY
jgi:hypothetical protein